MSNLVERLAVFSPMSHVTIHSQNLSNSVEKLVHFGQCRDAVPLMIRHASCLTALARSSTEVGIQHSSYLEVVSVEVFLMSFLCVRALLFLINSITL